MVRVSRPQQFGTPAGVDKAKQDGDSRRARLFRQLSIADLVGDPEGQATAKSDRQLFGHTLDGHLDQGGRRACARTVGDRFSRLPVLLDRRRDQRYSAA